MALFWPGRLCPDFGQEGGRHLGVAAWKGRIFYFLYEINIFKIRGAGPLGRAAPRILKMLISLIAVVGRLEG